MKARGSVSFITSKGRELFPSLSMSKFGPVIAFCLESGELTQIAYLATTLCGRDGFHQFEEGFDGLILITDHPDPYHRPRGEFFDRATTDRVICYAAGICDFTKALASKIRSCNGR